MRHRCAVLITLVVALTACGSPGAGGDTSCGEFREMSQSDQTAVIKDFLSAKGKSDPSNFEITANRLSAVAYCETAGSDSSPIKDIDG